MRPDEHYRAARERLTALAATLTDRDAATPVPACPGWTVKDVYAHLAGVCADSAAGNLEGAPGDAWTARQVEARRGRSLGEVVAEWNAVAPALEAFLATGTGFTVTMALVDVWTHEQDVRGALGRPGGRDVELVPVLLDRSIAAFASSWAAKGLPPARVAGSTREWNLGDGDAAATLRASDFELLRIFLGRRSRAQVLARWEGDGRAFVDALCFFRPAGDDIVE